MRSRRQKINELGFLSAILCMFVIFIHISSQGIDSLSRSSIQHGTLFFFWRFCQFVVQGFIFLSAIKISMKYKDKKFTTSEYISFIKNRFLVIFFPYVIWVMVYYIAFCIAGYFPFNFLDYIRYVFIGDLSAQFYFIIIIMQFYLLFPLWLNYAKKIKPVIGIILSFIITFLFVYYFCDLIFYISSGSIDFLYNDRIFTSYFCFFIMGCYVGLYYEKFKKMVTNYKNIIAVLFLITLVINTKISYDQFLGVKDYYIFGISHMIYCTFAILFWFLVCSYIDNFKNKFTKLLNIINDGSYYTYLSHCLIIIILNWSLRHIGIYNIKVAFIINVILVYSVSITGSYLYIKFKKKILKKKEEQEKVLV